MAGQNKTKNSNAETFEFDVELEYDPKTDTYKGKVKAGMNAKKGPFGIDLGVEGEVSYDVDDNEIKTKSKTKSSVKSPLAELEVNTESETTHYQTGTVTTNSVTTRGKLGYDPVASVESTQTTTDTIVNGGFAGTTQKTEIDAKVAGESAFSGTETVERDDRGGEKVKTEYGGFVKEVYDTIVDIIDGSEDGTSVTPSESDDEPPEVDLSPDPEPDPDPQEDPGPKTPNLIDLGGLDDPKTPDDDQSPNNYSPTKTPPLPGRKPEPPKSFDPKTANPEVPDHAGKVEKKSHVGARDNDPYTDGRDHQNEPKKESPGARDNYDVDTDGRDHQGWGSSYTSPVVLDLNGDGQISLIPLHETTAFFDVDDDGFEEAVGWIGPDDGFLVYDQNDSGTVDHSDELVLSRFAGFEGATDLDGLATFDSNEDGWFDAQDDEFASFRIWQDLDQDGESDEGELASLEERGITRISVQKTPVPEEDQGGSGAWILNTTEFVRSDGSSGLVGDVVVIHLDIGARYTDYEEGVIFELEGVEESVYFVSDGQVGNVDASLEGFDTVIGNSGDDQILSGGVSRLVALGFEGNDTLIGGAGDDWLFGGEGADSILGGDGDDVLMIDNADVVVDGGDGHDTAFSTDLNGLQLILSASSIEAAVGNDGNDYFDASGVETSTVLFGGGGNDQLIGSSKADHLSGDEGVDTLIGGDGDDLIVADATDSIDGGAGVDRLVFYGSADLDLDITELGVEVLLASEGDDYLRTSQGATEAAVISGGDGADTIVGATGKDVFDGESGNDHIFGGGGSDSLFGGKGNDLILGQDDADAIEGGAGDDTLKGGQGNDSIGGSGGDDVYIFGRGDGIDEILDFRAETIGSYENAVEQKVTYRYTQPQVSYRTEYWESGKGGAQKTIHHTNVTYKQQTLVETESDFTTVTRYEINQLDAGDDTLKFGVGITVADLILKLDGADLIVALNDPGDPAKPFEELADKVTIVDWANPYNRVETFAFDDGSSLDEQGILDLLATAGDDALKVDGGTAELRGAAGNDTLEGGDFEETLAGGTGDDTLRGGNESDTYRFGRGDGLDTVHDIGVEQVADGTEKVEIYQDTGTFTYKMDYWKGSSKSGHWTKKNKTATYDARYYEIVDTYADVAVDGGARDVLQFGAGIHVHDLMLQQVGDDLIVGVGDRNDPALTFELLTDKITIKDWFLDISRVEIFDFEDGFTLDLGAIIADVGLDAAALENWLQTAITVTPEGGYVVQGTTGDERFTGTQFADTLDGAGGDDLLVGKAGNDSLVGGLGQDTLEGGAGDDTLVAGDGADVLQGGEGDDRAVFSGIVANHTIQLTAEGATVIDLTAPESASTNLLTGIETVAFDDRVIDLTGTTNNAPVAVDGFAQLPVDTTVTGKLKAWDLDGDDLTYSIQNNAASGTAVVQADGSFIYTYDPNTGFEGLDSFEFQVMDSEGNTDTGIVSIEVFSEVTGDNAAVGTAEQQVNTFTAGDQHGSALAGFSDGSYVTVWYSKDQDGGLNGIYGQRYAADGTPDGAEFLINQATAPDQFDPSLTVLADDSFVVTWTSFDQNPGSNEIYARHYDSDGVALSGEFQVNTSTVQAQRESSVAALTDGGFVVTWTDWVQDGSGKGVYAQRYDSAVQAVGGEIRINESVGGEQDLSQVIGLANGGFVVVWEDGNGSEDVMARVYDSEGAPLTWGETIVGGGDSDGDIDGISEFLVNEEDRNGRQGDPSVAALAGGDFVVVWNSDHNFDNFGINGQRFSETGDRIGPEFDINTTGIGAQVLPSIVGLSDGGFVVAWQSEDQDGDLDGVYLQVFDPDGNKEGPEIQVNDVTSGDQGDVSITALPDGGFAVSWTSDGQDGDGNGVFTKTFSRTPHRNAFGFGPGDDAIVGTQHGDQLSGGGGDDFITGAGGADTIDGGVGQDLVSFAGSGSGVSVDLASGTGAGGDAEGDSLTSIEHLLGSDHADSLSGDESDNTIIGGAGEDSLSGAEGADSLFGDAGDDTLAGGKGDDHLSGGDGLDTAVFSGEAVDYDIQINGNEATITDLRTDGDGVDSLINVERARFADRVIHLDGTNNAPIMVDDFNATAEDTALKISPVLLLWNDFDLEGDTFSLTAVGDAVGGSVEIDALGVVVFTPEQDFEGEASFSYTATDSQGASHTAKVLVDVTPVNDAPVGIDSVVKITADSQAQGRATVTDVDAVDSHSFELQSGPNAGSVQVYSDGTYDYVPDSGFVGYDSFVVLIKDSGGLTSQATINVEVRPSDGAAETLVSGLGNDVLHGGAGSDRLEGGSGDDVLEGGSGDDTLAGGDGFDTAVLSGRAADYEVTINGNQTTVRDLRDGSPDGTDQLVDVERLWFRGDRALYIDGTNNAPVGVAAAALLPVDTVGNGRVTAWDYEGDALTFALDEGPQHGSVTVGEDGSYSYTPTAGFTGIDSFTVTVTDENGASDTSVVSVEVIADPNGEALILTGSAGQDLFVGGSGDDLLEGRAAGDDLDGGAGSDTASYESSGLGVSVDLETGLGAGGDAENDQLTNIENLIGSGFDDTLAGDAGDNNLDGGAGTDTVVFDGNAADYSVEVLADHVIVTDLRADGTDGRDTLKGIEYLRFSDRTLDLSAGGNAPVAVESAATTPKDEAASGRLTAWDIDGDGLSFSLEGAAIGGTVVVHADGRYDFTPDAGFQGEASFTYSVTDGSGHSSTASVSVQVSGNPTDGYEGQNEAVANTSTNGNQNAAAIAALAGGGYVVVWEDDRADGFSNGGIRAQLYDDGGSSLGSEIEVNSVTSQDQKEAAVTALSNGGFVITWTNTNGYPDTIRMQRYDGTGLSLGGEVEVSPPDGFNNQRRSQVVGLSDGGYVVVWADSAGEETYYARRFDALGQAVGGVSQVAEAYDDSGEPNPPTVAALTDGGYVVVWQDRGSSSSTADNYVLAQRYDANGSAVGAQTEVSGEADYNQDSAAVMGLPGGGFVVVWESASGPGNEIDGRIFDANGDPVDTAFRVNTYDNGSQFNPAVTALPEGGFIVTWVSVVSGSNEIRAQIYDALGVAVGSEFQINSYASGAQLNPAIAALAGGGFAVAWESNGQDGDDYGVITRIFKRSYGIDISRTGSLGQDMLVGGLGVDSLAGAEGADTLIGAAGADNLDGGGGSDTASYETSAAAVNIDLAAATASGGDAAGDVLTNIENLVGSSQSDVLSGDDQDNVLVGGDGDDTLNGGGGADTLVGGAGADALDGGVGFDTASYESSAAAVSIDLTGGTVSGGDAAGDSLSNIEGLVGSDFADNLQGDAAGNELRGGAGADTLGGAGGADTLLGGLGGDSLSGGSEDDVLVGGAGADTLAGNGGNDLASYEGSTGGVSIDLAAGSASGGDAAGDVLTGIEHLAGSDHADSLAGDALANFLAGKDGDDTLTAGAGNDTLAGGAGADTLSGGSGLDTASYEDALQGVAADLGGTAGSGDAAGDIFTDIENLSGSDYRDTLSGDAGDNLISGQDGGDSLVGRDGGDSLMGGAGNDVLEGGSGADLLDGGDGSDAASYQSSSAAVSVDLGTGTLAGGDAEGDSLIGIENVIGSDYADSLIGDAATNVLEGLDGDDTLSGGAGDDALFGDGGSDTLDGGAGADFIDGGDGFDLVTYEASTSAVSVNLEQGSGAGGDAEGDSLTGVEIVVGSGHDDTLAGDGLENSLSGGAGADVIDGGFGDDTLVGGLGADTLEGGLGYDIARYEDSGAAIAIDLYAGTADGGTAVGDSLSGIEGISATAFDDTLTGDDAANALRGGDGEDVLAAAAGDDTLIGGAGADTLDGGDDFDTVRYDESAAAVAVDLALGNGLGGEAEGDALSSVEAIFGSSHNDTLTGDDNGNLLAGQSGNDSLDGGSGNDTLVGDEGADNLVGGAGDDTLIGGAGPDNLAGGEGDHDLARYDLSDAGIAIDLGAGTATGGHADGDTISGVEHLIGSAFDDTLTGDAAGNDLIGGAGDDLLSGGLGADTLDGGFGNDTASYENSAEGVSADLAQGLGVGGSAAGDTYFSIENLVGSAYDDTLSGGAGNNTIDGGAGTDSVVFSGAATDYLVTTDPGGTITVSDQRASGADGSDHLIGIERLVFADRTLDLSAGGNAPVALGAAMTFPVGQILSGQLDAWDIDGDSLTFSAVGDADHGSVTVNGDGSFTYTPDDGFRGSDSFTYIVNDGLGGSDTATVLVTRSNAAAMPSGDTVTTAEDSAVVIDALANDTDPEGDALTASVKTQAQHGSVVLNPDGTFTYTPDGDFAGNDSFTYTVDDGYGSSEAATVTVTVMPVQDPVTAEDDTVWMDLDSPIAIDVLANDVDPDGDTISVSVDTPATNGSLSVNPDGTITYTPDAGYLGSDSFTYTINDGHTGTSTASVAITVSPTNGSFIGGSGHDYFDGRGGQDTLDGGGGQDTLLGGGGDDSLYGGSNDDQLFGGSGSDTVIGGFGDDTLNGGAGADSIDGGSNDDVVSYQGSVTGVTVNLNTGSVSGGDAEGDTLVSIEGVIGSDHDDVLTGKDNKSGGLVGGAGNDTLISGAGYNWLMGGEGADILDGSAGSAKASYKGSASGVSVNLSNGLGLGGDAEGDVLINIGRVDGSEHNDTLTAGDNGDDLHGLAGYDLIVGGAGEDELEGGAGNDTLYGGSGSDDFKGGEGADVLYGGDGDDRLDGESGNDTLVGGAGDDSYEFELGDGQDVIDNQDAVSTDDRLLFGDGIAPEDLWFQQDGNDLKVSVLGTSDKVTFTDWYLDAGQEIDVLETSSGETLLNSEVDQLVAAMAAFNPVDGTDPATLYDNNLPASVQTVVASSWQSPVP